MEVLTTNDVATVAQGVSLDELTPQRILFGFFPTYRASPLAPAFDRVLQVSLLSTFCRPSSVQHGM